MRVTVTRVFTIDWDGTPADYIRLANQLEPLDSLDLGDATAALVDYASRSGGCEAIIYHKTDDSMNLAQIGFEDELFKYDPPLAEGDIVTLTEAEL